MAQEKVIFITSEHQVGLEWKKEINYFLEDTYGLKVKWFRLLDSLDTKDKIDKFAEQLARIRILDIERQILNLNLFPAEIEYERKCLKGERLQSDLLYDGYEFQYILREWFPELFLNKRALSVLLTKRRILTFMEERRYHMRSVILGYPCIISIIGIVEAPAKPREYYVIKDFGTDDELNKWLALNKDRYLSYEDKRLCDVVKGYLVQCIYYWLKGGIDFCDDKNCALYNSHWQEDVLRAQYNKALCSRHAKEVEEELGLIDK
jgi:hypothetical protein